MEDYLLSCVFGFLLVFFPLWLLVGSSLQSNRIEMAPCLVLLKEVSNSKIELVNCCSSNILDAAVCPKGTLCRELMPTLYGYEAKSWSGIFPRLVADVMWEFACAAWVGGVVECDMSTFQKPLLDGEAKSEDITEGKATKGLLGIRAQWGRQI